MKCPSCGYENRDDAKFCTKCGKSLVQKAVPNPIEEKSNTSKYIIVALVIIIVILVATIGYFAFTMNSTSVTNDNVENTSSSQASQEVSSSQSSPATTQETNSKSWQVIGSYSGSGSGSKTINVPPGQIRVELSAYPIKNYATNHLYVKGSSASGGVDWGSHSDVETRSDSFEYTSSSSQTFTIDYYETVSWEVTFYKYQ